MSADGSEIARAAAFFRKVISVLGTLVEVLFYNLEAHGESPCSELGSVQLSSNLYQTIIPLFRWAPSFCTLLVLSLASQLEGMDSFFPALAILNAIGTYNAIAFGLALALALGQL